MSAGPPWLLQLAGVERQRGGGDHAFSLHVDGFRLEAGECLAVIGASGSGKSTFLDLLGLVLCPDRAETFRFHGRDGAVDIAAAWCKRNDAALSALRAREVGYVLQTGGLLPFLDVRQNVTLSRRLLGLGDDGFVDALLMRLEILPLATKKPRELSIGERQRVAIARAFAHRPRLVLADEPTASLDPHQGRRVAELMLSLADSYAIALLIVTHDWALARSLGLPEVPVLPEAGAGPSCSRIAYPPPSPESRSPAPTEAAGQLFGLMPP